MHGRKYRNAARTCERRLRQLRVHGRRLRDHARLPARARARRAPRHRAEFTPEGEAADIGAPYVLTVATLEPRKNLGTLVEAFAAARRTPGSRSSSPAARAGASSRSSTGPASCGSAASPTSELARLYRGAAAVVYPSRFEGFGMPITEAMASGAPVVASAHPSLDEACGDAAVRADPESPQAIADGDPRGARAPRRAARARASRTPRGSRGGAPARSSSRGTSDSRSDRHDAAPPDARRARRATCAGCSITSTCRSRVSFPATSRLRTARRRRALVSAPARADGADVLHCPTFRGPFRSRDAARRHRARSRGARAIRSGSTAGRATYSRLAVPRVVRPRRA